ncbi:polyprenyl synthetase family protein [Parafrigoribacterium soli]|uniref:polyprenyl synthetase family protein n=1 Tax=Parafrigoribacterium soli TaxID=3144663 RepID=UPI0032EB97DD
MSLATPLLGSSERVDEVSDRLTEFFRQKELEASGYGTQYRELWSAMRRSVDGGKRFRPALVVCAYHSLGGHRDDEAVVVATAFELLHSAFLLHDDVIDGDVVRRGQPNVMGTLASRALDSGLGAHAATRWGEAAAILAGDLLIHSAQALVARLDLAHDVRIALLDLLEECMYVTAAGELADVAFSTGAETPVLSQVISMAQWKTAHYSFQAPLQAGAVLAGAGAETLEALGEFGRNVGIAFQLRDDVLGVFGAAELTGKSTTSDIREGKATPMMCYALQRSESSELSELLERGDVSEKDAARVREILEAVGARSFIEQLIDDHSRAALVALDTPAVPEALRERLVEVVAKARERSS